MKYKRKLVALAIILTYALVILILLWLLGQMEYIKVYLDFLWKVGLMFFGGNAVEWGFSRKKNPTLIKDTGGYQPRPEEAPPKNPNKEEKDENNLD